MGQLKFQGCYKMKYIKDYVKEAPNKNKGKLYGVPFVVQNNILTTINEVEEADGLQGYESPFQATVIDRLEREGAVLIKSVADPAKSVATDKVPFALALDTAGQLRQLAAQYNIVGVRPSYGATSRYGVIGNASSMDAVGVLANSVEDAHLVLAVIAGEDARDPQTLAPYVTGQAKPAKKKIGIIKEFLETASQQQAEAIMKVRKKLEDMGHTVKEVTLPTGPMAAITQYLLGAAEFSSNMARFDGVRYGKRASGPKDLNDVYEKSRAENLTAEQKARIVAGNLVLTQANYQQYFLQPQKVRTLIIEQLSDLLDKSDYLLLPTSADEGGDDVDLNKYTALAALAGVPALNIPININDKVVGVQLIAAKQADDALMSDAVNMTKGDK